MREPVANPRPANIIGIHLGAINTAVARFNEAGKPEATNNVDGNPITPSVVQVEDSGAVVIGTEAKKFLGMGIPGVFAEFKREMGTDKSWRAGGRNVTPIKLTALLLSKVVDDYAEQFGEPDVIVITWPSNFRNEQRAATKEAARRAGLKKVHYLDEPVAVALYYGADTYLDGKYLIYNFDDGRLDVTLIEAHGNSIHVLYQDGVQQLGGKDLDDALLKIIGEKFRAKTGDEFDTVDCNFDKLAIESNKNRLSAYPSVSIRLVSAKHGPMGIDVSRNEFEAGISHLVSQAEMACANVLRCGKDDPTQHIKKSDIKEIFFAGEIARLPAMQASVERLFGKMPKVHNPDQAIAMGAAIYAAHKASKGTLNVLQASAVDDVDVGLIAPHFIGTSARDSDGSRPYNDIVIAKGTSLPCKIERSYFTTHENQTSFNFDVTQSAFAERDLDFVTKIWETSIKLPQGAPAGLPIKATFLCDMNGILSITIEIHGQSAGPCVTAKLLGPVPGELTP